MPQIDTKTPAQISSIMIDLLEHNPEKYYTYLCNLKNKYSKDYIKEIVDSCEYRTWFSNHLQTLIYVVGDLTTVTQYSFFGKNTVINEDIGIKIFNILIEYNVNIYFKDYYNSTAFDIINQMNSITYRTNNFNLKKNLFDLYDKKFIHITKFST